MSIHKSLKADRFPVKRSVRTRRERLEKLKRTEKWVEGMSIYGLPKEKILQIKLKIKKEKKELTNEDVAQSIITKNEGHKKKTSRDDTETRK